MRLFPAALALLAAGPALAAPVTLSGDLRLRLEDDFNDTLTTGAPRPDRTRLRVRARLNAKLAPAPDLALFVRVRTATPGSQQNPNVTVLDLAGGPADKARLALDRYELQWRRGPLSVAAGRMLFPFFTPNDYFWFGEVTALGGAAHVTGKVGTVALKANAAMLALPVGLDHFAGKLYAGQLVADAPAATVAASLFRFAADRRDPVAQRVLLDGNGARNYTVAALNIVAKPKLGRLPASLGLDLYRNLQSYAAASDPISRRYANARTGLVLTAALGDLAAPGHWQAGYRWSRVEKLAFSSSYAEIDLARFGTAAQGDLTDLKGHDLFANYVLGKHWTAGGRVMLAQRLSTRERGDRARVDLNYSF